MPTAVQRTTEKLLPPSDAGVKPQSNTRPTASFDDTLKKARLDSPRKPAETEAKPAPKKHSRTAKHKRNERKTDSSQKPAAKETTKAVEEISPDADGADHDAEQALEPEKTAKDTEDSDAVAATQVTVTDGKKTKTATDADKPATKSDDVHDDDLPTQVVKKTKSTDHPAADEKGAEDAAAASGNPAVQTTTEVADDADDIDATKSSTAAAKTLATSRTTTTARVRTDPSAVAQLGAAPEKDATDAADHATTEPDANAVDNSTAVQTVADDPKPEETAAPAPRAATAAATQPAAAQISTPAFSVAVDAQVKGPTPIAPSVTHTAAPPPPPPAPDVQFAQANHPQIVTAIHGQLLPDGGTMHIRLDPPELGALQVSVHMQDGVMSASFQTSNEDATRMLSHSLAQLKHALESQGVSVDKIHVQQAPRDQQSNNEDNRQQQGSSENTFARQEQQRREILQRMWRKLTNGSDPLDMVA